MIERYRQPDITYSSSEIQVKQHLTKRAFYMYACSTPELRAFVSERGIVSLSEDIDEALEHPNADSGTSNLIHTLELADYNAQLSRFGELPPELREHIYEYYMNDFSECILPLNSAQSPFTRCSRLIRHETLLIFYSTCTFDMRILSIKRYSYREDWSEDISPALTCLSLCGKQHIRHLRLGFEARHSMSVDDQSHIALAAFVTIESIADGTHYDVSVYMDRYTSQWSARKAEAVEWPFDALLGAVASRPKENKWVK